MTRLRPFVAAAFLLAGCSGSGNLVANPGFESASEKGIAKWQASAYVFHPAFVQFTADKDKHMGKLAAKIANLQVNDASLIQEVPVKGGRTYKVSGWIKTENVQSPQGPVGACLSIPLTSLRSASVKETTDWTEVQFYVLISKERTTMPLACRLGFSGSMAAGSAFFDDIRVQEVNLPVKEGLPEY